MADRLPSRLPLLIVAVTIIIVFYRLFLGEVLFWGLPALQFYPWSEYAFAMLRSGQLPLWNPYNGAGAPLIANYQSSLFYPLNWLGLILSLGFAMSITAVLHLFIAAWGMFAFTGRLGVPNLGRGVSALAFGMGSFLVAHLGTYPMIGAIAWISWVMWAAHGVLTRFRTRDVAYLAFFAALQLLAGHAQMTWYSMLMVGLFTLFWPLHAHPTGWWRRLMLVIIGLALGAGIAAVQLVPTSELLRLSQRSGGVDFEFAMNFSYSPVRTLNLLSPNVFGNPGDGSFVTEGAHFEDAVYIGLLPLIAAIAAVIAWIARLFRREARTQSHVYDPETSEISTFVRVESPAVSLNIFATVPFWLVIVTISYIFALGQNTSIYPFLFNNVPTFDLFQAPVRWHIWIVFGLSMLAGVGTQAWGRGYWLFFGTRLAIAGGIGAAILAIFVAPQFLDVESNPGLQVLISAVALTGILGAVAGALTLLQPERASRHYAWWAFAVLLFVAVDLIWAARGLNPTVPAAFYDRLSAAGDPASRAYWPAKVEEYVDFEKYLQFKDYRVATDNWQAFRASGVPNFNLLDRQYLLNNFDPLRVGHFAAYIDLLEANPQSRDALLQAAGVDSIYNQDEIREGLGYETARAWFVESICWHPNESALVNGLLSSDWQPLRQAHLIGTAGCPELPPEARPPGEVLMFQDDGNSVVMDVHTETGGLLILADTDYPGWTALIDGNPTRILRVNGAFRAVEVPAGSNRVEFAYRPGWLLPGILMSVVSLLLTLMLFRTRNPN
jgi:Bacterial membrane protein YfhO